MELEKKKATGIFDVNPNVCRAQAARTQVTGRLLDRFTEGRPAFTLQQALAMQKAWYRFEHARSLESGGGTSIYHDPDETKISISIQRYKNQEEFSKIRNAKGLSPISRPVWSAEQQIAMCRVHKSEKALHG